MASSAALLLAPTRSLVVQPPQGALVTTTTKEALTNSVAVLERGQKDLASLSRGRAGELHKNPLQRVRRFLESRQLNAMPAWAHGTAIACGIGCLGGFFAGLAVNSGWVWLEVWAGATAVGAAVSPLAAGVVKVGETHARIVQRRMVELPDLRSPVERFRNAEGAQKVQLGFELVKLRDALEKQRVLSPEARTALEEAAAEAEGLPPELRAMAGRLEKLAKVLSSPIDSGAVETIRTELTAAQPFERLDLATTLRELIFSDRKRLGSLDYDVRNRLHTVLLDAEKSGKENS